MKTTLFSRLNSRAKDALNANAVNYKFSVDAVILKLSSTEFYQNLTVYDVDMLLTFTDTNKYERTYSNWMYGEDLFE